MKIVLTGASGFLGSALARRWSGLGHRVVAPLRPGKQRPRLEGVPDLSLVEIGSVDDVAQTVAEERPDAIVHTACAYGRHGESLVALTDVNLRLGLALLDAATHLDVSPLFLNTGTVLAHEVGPYALSKQQFSAWGAARGEADPAHVRFVDVRLQHMYGPGDDASKFTSHVLGACRRNDSALDLTLGEQRRDFIFIDDVVDAYDCLLERRSDFRGYEPIDVGTGEAPSVRTFVETVHRLTGSTTLLRFGALPYRPNEAMSCSADLARMRALGWQPVHDLESGIERTLAHDAG